MPVTEGHTQIIPKCEQVCAFNAFVSDSTPDHAKKLGDLPDEYIRDIGPLCKKIALATGVEQYNIIQVRPSHVND